MAVFAITVFLSAFLLFQVQPIIAKMILPWFGGASAVWSTCMVFFQTALLGGYLYAHWIDERFGRRAQAWVHSGLLAASLLVLPVIPGTGWKPQGTTNPSARILLLLACTVGLPYFLLSSTSPLLQSWYARTHKGATPYRLFALSNLASMLALLTYPVLVEPRLSTGVQGWTWSAAYACFAVICAWTAWRFARVGEWAAAVIETDAGTAPGRGLQVLWLALAGCASLLMLAITNFLTQDVAAIPFLWIVPLAVYLATFIVCFEAPRLYVRGLYLPLATVALGEVAYRVADIRSRGSMVAMIAIFSSALFVMAMVCHGELVARRPHPRYLTRFYVMVSLGGALGGLFVGLVAPNLFNAYYELPIGLVLFAGLLAWVLIARASASLRPDLQWPVRMVVVMSCVGYAVYLGLAEKDQVAGCRIVERNFYGELRVVEVDIPEDEPLRSLLHGVINHGQQDLMPEYRHEPVSYYCKGSGVSEAFANVREEKRTLRAGILGLGCGTLLAFGRAGDVFWVYEINPLVLRLARSEFTYLGDSQAKVNIVLGDARLSLEREPSQQFDVLVMDAFSGDSVPAHLLTREAFRTYFRHLAPGGILAVNVSNRYLNLQPVVEEGARYFGRVALLHHYIPTASEPLCFAVSWVLVVEPGMEAAFKDAFPIPQPKKFRAWTDNYSSIFGILK